MKFNDSIATVLAAGVLAIGLADGAAAAGVTESVLYSFSGTAGGSDPEGGLVADTAGNLYGTAQVGGSAGYGVVFELTKSGQGWTETVLHAFTRGNDGGNPFSTLLIDAGGTLYGTTAVGGAHGQGLVFSLTPPAGNAPKNDKTWTETVLHNFGDANPDGSEPFGNLAFDDAGILYGTTLIGGANGAGAVYSLTPPVSGGKTWKFKLIHSFGSASGGTNPFGGVVFDHDSASLLGTTLGGGKFEAGTAFLLAPHGSGWQEKVLHSFTGVKDGSEPSGQIAVDAGGNVYGVAAVGGNGGAGIVYQLTPPTGGNAWKFHILHSFSGGNDGQFPIGGVTLDTAGNLYGTTAGGGPPPPPPQSCIYLGDALAGNLQQSVSNCGVVFELQRSGQKWKFHALYDFTGWSFSGVQDGVGPDATIMFDPSGTIYGTTTSGGTSLVGTVFQLKR